MKRSSSISLVACALSACLAAAGASAQEQRYSTWSKVENAAETKAYKDAMRDGEPFDATQKAFLTQIALPQLMLDANRPVIDRVVRRRIRELLLMEIAEPKTFDAVSGVVLDFMVKLARNPTAAAVVRVNAMILVGELQSKDSRDKPLPAAAAPLAAAAADSTLPAEVRIAAAAGLARHVKAAKDAGAEALAGIAATTGPALVAMLAPPAAGADRAAADWLACRALDALKLLGSAAPREAAATASKILLDDSRATDVRVRAAAALGTTISADSGVDAAKVLDAIRGVAVATLEADEALVEERKFTASLGGDAPVPGMAPSGLEAPAPTGEPPLPPLACRREAWRLATLATALLAADESSGLGLLPGGSAAAAKDLAGRLRQAASILDGAPEIASIGEALATLGQAAAPAGDQPDAKPVAPSQPGTDKPAAEPAPGESDSPFGESPFGTSP